MTTDVVPVKSGGTADFVSTSLRHGFAGAICGVLTIAYSLSYAALIFSGPIAQWLSYGIAVTFLSAAVGGAVIALRSSLPFAVAGPDSTNSAVIAVLVGALVQRLLTDHPTEDILPPVLILMAIGTALTGALLLGLGLARAGAAIRFLPYPVVGGFLGATGWLLVTGAMHVSTGQPVALSTIALLLDVSSLPKIAAALAVAIVLFAGRRALRSPLALPALLIASIAAFHLVLVLLDTSVEEARAAGWTFWPEPVPGLALPWHADALLNFPWAALPSLSGDLLAVMFVSVVTMLLNTTGTEFATRREADLDHELKVHGIANLLTAALGGYISSISVSRSTLNYLAGARERGAGLVAAAIPAAMIGLDPAFLGFLPKCAFGGLLFFVGLDLIYRWIFDSWRRLAPIEYLSLLAIASIIIG